MARRASAAACCPLLPDVHVRTGDMPCQCQSNGSQSLTLMHLGPSRSRQEHMGAHPGWNCCTSAGLVRRLGSISLSACNPNPAVVAASACRTELRGWTTTTYYHTSRCLIVSCIHGQHLRLTTRTWTYTLYRRSQLGRIDGSRVLPLSDRYMQ